MIGVGIIGYGFMGRTHAAAYQCAQRDGFACQLVAIADAGLSTLAQDQQDGTPELGTGSVDLAGVQLFDDVQALLDHSGVDLVSICTPTDTHVDLAIRALRAGKHVLVEKPVAIDQMDVRRLSEVAKQSPEICMPAMCMRYWPAWVRIYEFVRTNRYGPVRSATFERLGSMPGWSADFYADEARSGGMLTDLHIHDTDFIVHCFGTPDAVTTAGGRLHLSTAYHYTDGPACITGEGAWDRRAEDGFVMRCRIECERATLDFDLARDDQLIVHESGQALPIEVGGLTGYDGQVRAMLGLIAGNAGVVRTTMDDAVIVAGVLDAERRSLRTRRRVEIDQASAG